MKLLLLIVVILTVAGCGGGDASPPVEVQALRQQVAQAQASAANWKMVAVIALVVGGVVGLILGGRDES